MGLNLPTILVLIAIGLAISVAIFFLIKNRGKSCSSCNGDCAACRQIKSK